MISAVIRLLSHPTVVFYTLPWLMVLLVFGTLAQRYIGLYEAERLFFSSWLVWVGPAPLPGAYPTLGLLSLGLLVKLLVKSPWNKAKSGIIITHFGALLLLLGGLLTAMTSEEGYISLAAGESSNTISDYHRRELAVLKNGKAVLTIAHRELHDDLPIHHAEIPFTLTVERYCLNCAAERLDTMPADHRGLAQKVMIKKAPLQKEDENNQAGVVFRIRGIDDQQDGLYLAFEPTPHQPSVMVGEDVFTIAMRKEQRPMPFTITLESFEKQVHPGTQTAKEYQSEVTISESEGVSWRRLIRMNEPLRVQGYTLYQSSFVEANGLQISVLAVVKNHGRSFPYIASVVMAIGLSMHALRSMRNRRVADA